MFVRAPKNMRKDKIIWKLLKAMYGTQVASSRWQRLVRETLCDGHWKVLTSVPCVAYNEKEDSLVLFHGDDVLAESQDSSLDRVDEVLGAFEIKRMPRIGPAAGREVSFYTEGYGGTNLDPRIDQIPNTWTRSSRPCRWKMRDLLQDHSHVTLDRVKPTLCAS